MPALAELRTPVRVTACMGDAAFDTMAATSLLWLPAHGIGYLPVSEQPYDDAYFRKYEEYAATEMGAAITEARVALVDRHAGASSVPLVDVGIGSGDFLEAMQAAGFLEAYGYDVNPRGVDWLRAHGWLRDPYADYCEVATFWDAIEHIPDAAKILANVRRWVFCSLPIVPGDGPPRSDWRHYRPDEHCWYWTRRGFLAWMAAQGFACVEHNTMESLLGRQDIETFALRRVR